MIQLLVKLGIWFCIKTGRIQNISGRADPENIYMIRYIVFRSQWFSIYIHQFLRSDQDSYHDHPWSFSTYIVSGVGYKEHQPDIWADKWINEYHVHGRLSSAVPDKVIVRSTVQNRFQFRNCRQLHWVELDRTYLAEEKDIAPTTICFIGRRQRNWGFIDPASRQWVFWKKFLGIPFSPEEQKELTPSSEG